MNMKAIEYTHDYINVCYKSCYSQILCLCAGRLSIHIFKFHHKVLKIKFTMFHNSFLNYCLNYGHFGSQTNLALIAGVISDYSAFNTLKLGVIFTVNFLCILLNQTVLSLICFKSSGEEIRCCISVFFSFGFT